jgi:hypothetical protein
MTGSTMEPGEYLTNVLSSVSSDTSPIYFWLNVLLRIVFPPYYTNTLSHKIFH